MRERADGSGARGVEVRAERRALRNAALVCVGVVFTVYVINALSISTEFERAGREIAPGYPWILEGTAIAAMIAGLPVVLWFGHRFRFEPGRWRTALAVHLAGLLLYALIQVALMSALRSALWPLVFGAPHDPGDTSLGVFVYELRKQAGTYAGFQLIVAVSRHIELLALEARAARSEARASRRITLKCGGRTLHPDASEFVFAKAAGNYVEARFGAREHLARIALAGLEKLLIEAGIDAVRSHRSVLVNRARIAEIVPTGEGDVTIRLDEGSAVPGSRRYRALLESERE